MSPLSKFMLGLPRTKKTKRKNSTIIWKGQQRQQGRDIVVVLRDGISVGRNDRVTGCYRPQGPETPTFDTPTYPPRPILSFPTRNPGRQLCPVQVIWSITRQHYLLLKCFKSSINKAKSYLGVEVDLQTTLTLSEVEAEGKMVLNKLWNSF